MFKYINKEEQIQQDRHTLEQLQTQYREIEDALVELAGIVASNEGAVQNG